MSLVCVNCETFSSTWYVLPHRACVWRGAYLPQDRVYAPAQRLPVIYDAGVLLFYKHIIEPPIEDHLVDAVLDEVRVERDGFAINQSAVRGCVDVLCLLQDNPRAPTVYLEKLEPPLLDESRRFYEAEGKQKLESCSAPEYLTHVSTWSRTFVNAFLTHGLFVGG